MAKTAATTLYAVVAVAMLLSSHVAIVAEAASCNPGSLSPCFGALTSNGPPSSTCCSNLKSQGPTCLCAYKNNPAFAAYINNPNARRVVSACKVAYPNC